MNQEAIHSERFRILAEWTSARSQMEEILGYQDVLSLAADAPNMEGVQLYCPEALSGLSDEEMEEQVQALGLLCDQLEASYLELLPAVPIGRCPFTGQVVHRHIDLLGLDGPWWDYHNPIRPYEEAEPYTFLGYSGCLQLSEPYPKTSFTVMPGPSAPTIVPALLKERDIRAVLCPIDIAGNTGVIVSWYAAKDRHQYLPPNTWGAPWCDIENADGQEMRGPSPWTLLDFDVELLSWLRHGKLFWIAPGDTSMLLRADVDACPYLTMGGDGKWQYLLDGNLESLGISEDDMSKQNMTDEEIEEAERFIAQEDREDESAEEEETP